MVISYLFEDLYIWMLEEISFLQKKGITVVPICIRSRKATAFSNDFLGAELSKIAGSTYYLLDNIFNPLIWGIYIKYFLIHPVRMIHLHYFLIKKMMGISTNREFKFRDLKVIFLFTQIIPILQNNKINHVHCHFASYSLTYMYYLNYIRPTTHTVTVHAADIFLKNNFRKEKLFTTAKIFSISNYNKEFLIDCCGESIRDKIVVIYTGTDVSRFTMVPPLKTDPFTIMSLAVLVEHKGLRYLIDACKMLKDRHLKFKLNIYGKGPAEEELRTNVMMHQLSDYVTFKGRLARESVVPAFQDSSVFVLPSVIAASNGLREGIPQVFKECMACGIPAISTYTGSIPEIIDNGKSGFLVHERDAKDIADKIEFMITHPEESQKMSFQARKKIEEDFNIDKHTEKMISAFKMITGDN
jgi:colanic acid/amylovoran biosynthesis glycosyltransferase